MTNRTFFRKLQRESDRELVIWRVTEDGRIRCEFKGRSCSPLTFLLQNGKRNINSSVMELANSLGIDKELACNLYLASEIGDPDVLGNVVKLREKLIRVLRA